MLAHLKRLAITKMLTSSDVVQSKEYDNLKPWQGEPRSSLGIIELNGGHVTSLRNAPPSFKFNFYSQYFGLSFNFMFHSQYFGTSFKFQYISATKEIESTKLQRKSTSTKNVRSKKPNSN